jgi:maltooligosyltrehalose trehalohydrolase
VTRPRLWAPRAESVELVVEGRRAGMAPTERGWFEAPIELDAGTDYAYALDQGEPLPDPRSPWQPHGVNGFSRTVDHEAFAWSDEGWPGFVLGQSVLYELHIGTFSAEGTFDGAIAHLPDLVALGVTAVEVMPIAEFSGQHGWGYDGVDLYAPHHAYGGPDGFRRLVDACHAAGLGVVLDVVYNHLGPSGNYLDRFGPYFTDTYGTPWGTAVNVDGEGSDEVRAFIIEDALMWLRDYHVDGLRLDAVHAIYDMSAVHVLEELSARVDELSAELGRPLWVIAESDQNNPRLVRARSEGGYGLHAHWLDDVHHAIHTVLTGERDSYYADYGTLADLAKALTNGYVYDGQFSPHRQRRHGRPPTGVPADRFVVAIQNHDQIGNRAQGDRLNHLVGIERAKVAAALLLTAPFVPMLFQGEEWAASTPFQYFTDHEDPELGKAVSEGRRKEFAGFGWKPEDVPDPQDRATFERSVLRWDERQAEPHASMVRWYTDLIALRRSTPALLDPDLAHIAVEIDEAAGTVVVRRGEVTVAANLGTAPTGLTAQGQLRLASSDAVTADGRRVSLPPDAVAVLVAAG